MTQAATPPEETVTEPDPVTPERETGRLDTLTVFAVVLVSTALLGVAFYGSFHAISGVADSVGVEPHWLPPIMIDVGLAGFILLDLAYTRWGEPQALLKQAVRGFTILTVLANGVAGWPDPIAVMLHVPAAIGILVITESVRGYLLRRMDAERGNRYDPVPVSRWFLSPFPTFLLWRRMRLWRETSYERALDTDITRRDLIDQCRALGSDWKKRVPRNVRRQLRQGVRLETIGPRVDEIVAAHSGPAPEWQVSERESSTPEPENVTAPEAEREILPAQGQVAGSGQQDTSPDPEWDPDPTPPGGQTPPTEPVPSRPAEPAPEAADPAPERDAALVLSPDQQTIDHPVLREIAHTLGDHPEPTTQRELTRWLLYRAEGATRLVAAELKYRFGLSKTPADLYKYRAPWVREVVTEALKLRAVTHPDTAEDTAMADLPETITNRTEADAALSEWRANRTNVVALHSSGDGGQ